MHDPEEPSVLRLRAAEIILDKAMPRPKARDDHVIIAEDRGGPQCIEIRFVRPGEAPPLVEARSNRHPGTFSVSFDAE